MSDTSSREQRLEEALHAYLQAADRGERPDREDVQPGRPAAGFGRPGWRKGLGRGISGIPHGS